MPQYNPLVWILAVFAIVVLTLLLLRAANVI